MFSIIYWSFSLILSYFLIQFSFFYFIKLKKISYKNDFKKLNYFIFIALINFFLFLKFKISFDFFVYLFFTMSLVLLSILDLKFFLLPDCITLSMLWLGLLYHAAYHPTDLSGCVYAAACGYMILWMINFLFFCMRRNHGLGCGDFKLSAMIGAWLGLSHLLYVVCMAFILGAVAGCILLWSRKIQYTQALPFGPYLSLAACLSLLV